MQNKDKPILNKKAFTLVELIVVITILAILATIWFTSMQWYAKSARESQRVSDLTTIRKSLEFFRLQEWYFPDPTDFFPVTYSGSLAWRQGIFWEDTRKISKWISDVPLDPLVKNEYSYSTTHARQEYELWSISETLLSHAPLVNNAYATSSYYSYIKWNYNKQIVTIEDAGKIYILWAPTLITTEITDVTVQEVLANQSFAISWSKNLPSSYANKLSDGQTHTWATSFSPGTLSGSTTPLLYEWNSASDLSPDSQKQLLWENLKSYYGGSNIASQADYTQLINTPTWEIVSYVNTMIQSDTWGLSSEDIVVNVSQWWGGSSSSGGGSPWGCTFGSSNIWECNF